MRADTWKIKSYSINIKRQCCNSDELSIHLYSRKNMKNINLEIVPSRSQIRKTIMVPRYVVHYALEGCVRLRCRYTARIQHSPQYARIVGCNGKPTASRAWTIYKMNIPGFKLQTPDFFNVNLILLSRKLDKHRE